MNDRSDQRRHGEPEWPSGGDPDAGAPTGGGQPVERTGFWSPLWEEDDEPGAGPARPSGPPPRTTPPQPQVTRAMNTPGSPHTPPPPNRPMPPGARPPGMQPPVARPGMTPPPGMQPPPPGMGRPPMPPRQDPAEAPTVMLPPPRTGLQSRSEPELLTHREPDYEDDYDDDYGPEEDSPLTDEEAKKLRRKKIWRRVRRTAYVCTALGIIIPVVAFFITYQMVEVDNPVDVANRQAKAVTLKYAGGEQLAKIAGDGANRTLVTYDQIPEQVLNAVYAAEDQTFRTNSGFDLTGILRAVWKNVSGGSGGGSTISQQYIKQASGDDDATLTRKWVEVVKAYKMNETYSKEDIITAYLNTIYFGRGAYGIAAAAKAYFNVDVQNLQSITKSQAALIAGMIQTPAKANKEDYQRQRWDYVSNRMIENKWMTAEEKAAQPFPAPLPAAETKGEGLPGPLNKMPDLVGKELEKVADISWDDVIRNGYVITLTIDKQAQELAETAVNEVMAGQPATLHPGLVAITPENGNIVAYYPGAKGTNTDYAAHPQEPGSAFKPFDLLGLLKKGKGIYETYDSAPKAFGGSRVVKNASTPGCGECTVAQAMKESLNVVFSDMVYNDVKPANVAEAAREAGVLSSLEAAQGDINIAIGGGATQVTTVDMASAYATFASGGKYRKPHLVAKVEKPDGTPIFDATTFADYQEKLAFDQNESKNQQIARNVTETLLPIPKSSGIGCAGEIVCAGKTGTHQYQDTRDNAKAWMVGYTRSISAAVSLSGDKDEPRLRDKSGGIVYGGGLPGKIWKKFMDSYHKAKGKTKAENFGKFTAIGKAEPKKVESSSNPPSTTTVPPTTTTDGKPTKTTEPSESDTTTTTKTLRPPRTTTEPVIGLPGPGDGDG